MSPDDCYARRTRFGLSTYELALRAGLAEGTVKRFEAARVAPRSGTLIALRRAFRELERDAEGAGDVRAGARSAAPRRAASTCG
jgi:predicted transcriptional regulator